MRQRTAAGIVLALLGLLVVVYVYYPPLWLLDPGSYESTTVTIEDRNGTTLGTVDARISDTEVKRYVGLSETDSLADGEGMLFVHGGEGSRSYVMRDMSFPLDIVFVGSEGEITEIHHAPVPEEAEDGGPYEGRGRYVLEVPRGWTNQTGVDVGDTVVVPDGVD